MAKKRYEEIKLTLIRFGEADVLTYSENDYDNTDGWNSGWNDDWLDAFLKAIN